MNRVLLSNNSNAVTMIFNQNYSTIYHELIKDASNTIVYPLTDAVEAGLNTVVFSNMDLPTILGINSGDTVSLVCLANSVTQANVGSSRTGTLTYAAPDTTFTTTVPFVAAGACNFGIVLSDRVTNIVLSDMEYGIADKQNLVLVENLTDNRLDYVTASLSDASWHRIEFTRVRKLIHITATGADLVCTVEDPTVTPLPRNSDNSVRPYPDLMDPVFQPATTYPKTFTVKNGTTFDVDVEFLDWKIAFKTMWVKGNGCTLEVAAY